MRSHRYEALISPAKGWPPAWKNPFHVWLLDAVVMVLGAWIFLIIGHLVLRIMRALLL